MVRNCDKCNKIFDKESELYKHLLTHQEELDEPIKRRKRDKKEATCSECGKVFKSKSDLDAHKNEHYQENDDNMQPKKRRGRAASGLLSTCKDCKEVFYRRCDLRLHRSIEHSTKKNTCKLCKRSFSSEKRYKMHYQFHNVDGAYQCVYCDKTFNKGWKLKIHLVNHNGRSPYICQLCGEDYLYPGKITDHLKREHDLYFVCQDCGIGFRTLHELEQHICCLYTCKDCHKIFFAREELVIHIESHKTLTPNVKQEDTLSSVSNFVQGLNNSNSLTVGASVPQNLNKDSETSKAINQKDSETSKVVKQKDSEKSKVIKQESDPLMCDDTSESSMIIKQEQDDPDQDNDSLDVNVGIIEETTTSDVLSKPGNCMNGLREIDVNSIKSETDLTTAQPNACALKEASEILRSEDIKDVDIGNWEYHAIKLKPVSLKTWLTSDNTPCVTNDFVFNRGLKDPNSADGFIKSEIKAEKEEYPLSFEELCDL